eukprot:13820017-Alexandrium_andersonii.AAC.1
MEPSTKYCGGTCLLPRAARVATRCGTLLCSKVPEARTAAAGLHCGLPTMACQQGGGRHAV